MGNVKTAVYEVLKRYHAEKGTQVTIEVAKNTLARPMTGVGEIGAKEFHQNFNGEVCETILEILIEDYCKKYPKETKGWKWNKGVILPDRGNVKSDFLTEIDFILFTPECIYIFECKSYAGDKVLVRDGTINRAKGNNCDVFKQNSLHLEVLKSWMDKLSQNPVYQMVLFDFSSGKMTDSRTQDAKQFMPCVNEKTLYSIFSNREGHAWDTDVIESVHKLFNKETEQMRQKHLKYVKSLNH